MTLVSLMLAWSYDPSYQDAMAPHVAASSDEHCLSLEPMRGSDRLTFSTDASMLNSCTVSHVPLMRETMLGTGTLFSGVEVSNPDVNGLRAHEVKLKFGVGRDLFAGLHLALDGSIGRLLSDTSPMFEEEGHVSLTHAFNSHWDTGLENQITSLTGNSLSQLTERNTLAFIHARYSAFDDNGDEHRGEMKLSADMVQGNTPNAGRHARAEFHYEYHHDNNILSVGLNIVETAGHNPAVVDGGKPLIRLDLRAIRRF